MATGDDFPALPAGFTAGAPSTPAPATAPVAPPSDDFPALPSGFTAGTTSQPPAPIAPKLSDEDYNKQLVAKVRDVNNTKDDIAQFAKDNGRGVPTNLDEVMNFRDQHGGAVSDQVMTLPKAGSTSAIENFIDGLARAPMRISEGIAPYVISVLHGAGLINDTQAEVGQQALKQRTDLEDAKNIRGAAGTAGDILGEGGITSILPVGKGGSALTTIAKRAAVGGLVSGTSGASGSAGGQLEKGAVGVVTAPLLIPIFERLSATLGGAIGSAYTKILSRGAGQQLIDEATGAFTKYGNVLRARLRSISPDIPDNFIDESLRGIAQTGNKTLPADKDIVNTGLAQAEGVPLTGGMKTRNVKQIQDLGSVATGAIGSKSDQNAANAVNQNIDSAIVGNVAKNGTGQASADAADNVGLALHSNEAKSTAAVNALYQPLKDSAEKVAQPGMLKDLRNQIYDSFGQGGSDTLGAAAKGYLNRLGSLAGDKKLRFGAIWDLSRSLNADVRNATGQDIAQLGQIKSQLDKFISTAPADFFENGSNGVFQQLKDANTAYAQHKALFGSDPLTQGNSNFTDTAGKGVERVIALTKRAVQDGEPIPSSSIEKTIFGASGLSKANNAPGIVTSIIKAAPEAQPHIRDMVVNRLVDDITNTIGGSTTLKQNASQTINDLVDKNRPLLTAAGFSDNEIESLQRNAYLASLKSPPVGAVARGSSVTNRAIASKTLRHVISTTLAAAGLYSHGVVGLLGGAAAEGAGAASERLLAAKALSLKTPTPLNATGKAIGSAIGANAGLQVDRDAVNGVEQ